MTEDGLGAIVREQKLLIVKKKEAMESHDHPRVMKKNIVSLCQTNLGLVHIWVLFTESVMYFPLVPKPRF